MFEFIEELKYNQKINNEKKLENRVDIDYVIERLTDINEDLKKKIEFFRYHNKNLTVEQYETIMFIYESLTSEGSFN